MPVGSTQEVEVNARVVAATNRDIEAEVKAGRFREDLYFRLNVVQILVPPLRDRAEDVPLLVRSFLEKYAREYNRDLRSVSPGAMAQLLSYRWPGNVRELSHCIERAVILASSDSIDVKDLALERSQAMVSNQSELMTFEEGERRVLKAALTHYRGNVVSAAEYLGLSKSAMYRRLEKLSIEPKEFAS